MEDSYKYSPAEIDALLEAAGLRRLDRWLDSQARFAVVLAAPAD
jgi:uncharacterized SAM-dependent methyltransferase